MERRVVRLFEEEGITDLTPAQGNVLMVLFHQRGPTKARRLAQELNVSEVTMGRFIAALEGSGWIERQQDPDDARARPVSPTARAYQSLSALIRVSNRMMDEAFQGFAESDIAAFHRWTEKVIMNLKPNGEI
jgi:DNA-binding MarR family transcriptional regulator